jgi:hypothetical protein
VCAYSCANGHRRCTPFNRVSRSLSIMIRQGAASHV